MKRPNGGGCVVKLGGKRRKPYAVRVTTGWTDEGKQTYAYLGYYVKRAEAELALAEYTNNPYNINLANMTFQEVYNRIKERKRRKCLSLSTLRADESAYRLCEPLHNVKIKDIRTSHMQAIVDSCTAGNPTQCNIRSICQQVLDYGRKNDIVKTNYADYIEVSPYKPTRPHTPYTADELDKLWDHVDKVDWVDTILIMIYTGMRVGELLGLEIANVDLEAGTLCGGSKTDAGKDRLIPIHHRVLPLVSKRLQSAGRYLIQRDGGHMSYKAYSDRFRAAMYTLGMDHTPHDCRHTFATLLSNGEANKVSITKLMGHTDYKLTGKVYTHKDIDELRKAVETIR